MAVLATGRLCRLPFAGRARVPASLGDPSEWNVARAEWSGAVALLASLAPRVAELGRFRGRRGRRSEAGLVNFNVQNKSQIFGFNGQMHHFLSKFSQWVTF